MTLDQTGNNRQDDQNFQDNEKQFKQQETESPTPDHSISDNAEPDFGNDLRTEEFNQDDLGKEGLGNNEFEKDELNIEQQDDEFKIPNEDQQTNENFDNEGLGNQDNEDEIPAGH